MLRRLVRRPVVHNDDVIDRAAKAFDDLRDRSGLVQGRDDGGNSGRHRAGAASSRAAVAATGRRSLRSSAGSTRTDAAASATVLATDTMPIDRNGGYEDQISVA